MIVHHTEVAVPKTKVAITLESALVDQVDDLVAGRRFRNRSQAIEAALADHLRLLSRARLAEQCRKLDPREEKALANEGIEDSLDKWPEY